MARKSKKPNALRLLEEQGIAHTVHTFPSDIHSAIGVAEAVGKPPNRVFKTLVVLAQHARRRPLLAIIPGDRELDLKKLAQAAGEKRVRMATHKEAEALTHLKVGGISALALLQKHWDIYLDETALDGDTLLVSAGQRGINVELSPSDLIALTDARVAPLTREENPVATGRSS